MLFMPVTPGPSIILRKVPYLDQRYRHLIKPHFDFQIY
jgi:hypothetical protein